MRSPGLYGFGGAALKARMRSALEGEITMTDTGVVNSIRCMLDGVTDYDELKTVARDLQRRSLRLDADKAAMFRKGQKRCTGPGGVGARMDW
jgi:hypothetical protein